MSTLRTDNLTSSNGVGGSIPMSFAVQGTAKCWFNLNGTGTIAARDDFNVASYTDNGTGDYTSNFSTARPNANYGGTVTMGNPSTASERNAIQMFSLNSGDTYLESAPTTSAFRMALSNTAGNGRDNQRVSCSVHGDPH